MVELRDLIPQLDRGEYAVPEIQRGYVWKNPRVKDLVESISARYPIGSIVVWRLPKGFAQKYHQIIRPLSDDLGPTDANYLVIDGQQRLTSLLLLHRGDLSLGGDPRSIRLFFDASHSAFELGRPETYRDRPEWYSVTDLLKEDPPVLMDLKKAVPGAANPYSNPLILQNLNRLRLSLLGYHVHFVETFFDHPDDLDDVLTRMSRMFVSLNSKGTKIRMPDLVLALLSAAVRGQVGESFRERFNASLEEAESVGFQIEDAALVRAFTAIAVDRTRFTESRELLEKMSGDEILERFSRTDKAIKETVRLFQNDLGLKSDYYLYSRYYVVPVAYEIDRNYLAKRNAIPDSDKSKVRKWLVGASATGRYTGELERLLDDDISSLREGAGWDGLFANLKSPFVKETDIADDADQRFESMLLMLYSLNGAPDWLDPSIVGGATVPPVKSLVAEQLELHHIFPKRFMRRVGYKGDDLDHGGNLTLISKPANQRILEKDPADYLAEVGKRHPDALAKHFVPSDPRLWRWKSYRRFLGQRTRLIASEIEKQFGIPVK